MEPKEIHNKLGDFANEFKSKVAEHFAEKGINVKLDKIEFSLEKQNLEKFLHGDHHTMSSKCYRNALGQMICE